MNGYKNEIGCLQVRHLPHKNNHESTGTLSCHAIGLLHCGHDDRGVTTDCPRIRRYARTFKNDPQHRKKGIKK